MTCILLSYCYTSEPSKSPHASPSHIMLSCHSHNNHYTVTPTTPTLQLLLFFNYQAASITPRAALGLVLLTTLPRHLSPTILGLELEPRSRSPLYSADLPKVAFESNPIHQWPVIVAPTSDMTQASHSKLWILLAVPILLVALDSNSAKFF